MGMLFKFHGSLEYWLSGCVSTVGMALDLERRERRIIQEHQIVIYLP